MDSFDELVELDRMSQARFGRAFIDLDSETQLDIMKQFTSLRMSRKRTNVSRNWWVRRMLDYLEEWVGSESAAGGRALYRKGHVSKKMKLEELTVNGRVRGSGRGSYQVFLYGESGLAEVGEILASVIAETPKFYLDFCEGKLSEGLAEVLIPGGGLFRDYFWLEGDCGCYEYVPCKHLVALGNAAADLFERDLKAGFAFFGIDFDGFSRRIMELRAAGGFDHGLSVPTQSYDDFGWPVIEESKRITSTRRYWKYPIEIVNHQIAAVTRQLDVMAEMPKNRISGMNGTMNEQFSEVYRSINSGEAASENW